MPRGRPFKTEIRERIATLISNMNFGYGYELYKMYKQIFGPVGLRNFYYNLKKGTKTGEFVIIEIKTESGEFTWGGQTQHIYYTLGPYANIINLSERQITKLGEIKPRTANFDWNKEIDAQIELLSKSIDDFLAIETRLRYEDKRKTENKFRTLGEQLKEWAKTKNGDRSSVITTNKKIEIVLQKLIKN